MRLPKIRGRRKRSVPADVQPTALLTLPEPVVPYAARHRRTDGTPAHDRASTRVDTHVMHPRVVDGPRLFTPEQAHAQAATYRAAALPTPYEQDRVAELEGDVRGIERPTVIVDTTDLVRPWQRQARPA